MKNIVKIIAVTVAFVAALQTVEKAVASRGDFREQTIDENQKVVEGYMEAITRGQRTEPNFRLTQAERKQFIQALRAFLRQSRITNTVSDEKLQMADRGGEPAI